MRKQKIFISSVQSEFVEERQMLNDYLLSDALLCRFFVPFIFENIPALNQRADRVYLEEVNSCDIYLGILGKEYGSEDDDGVSPTEREYDVATIDNKYRLIFLTEEDDNRHPKEQEFIRKIEKEIVRKKFSSPDNLKTCVYSALIRYLEEKGLIRSGPFDASICEFATIENDLDSEKIADFVRMARAKRGFPLPDTASPEKVLTHLDLTRDDKLTNASILLFGNKPQQYFISSVIKCVQFHGNRIVKPVPAYQIYKGDLFQLVNQAVDFVMSRINVEVGLRETSVNAPLIYEIPRPVVTEAIVNAIAHKDYTSAGSVQVMLFRDRVEIWNPGQLPHNLTIAMLKEPHASIPANPLIANPLYLAGLIEQLGTGILDMFDLCNDAGLKEPIFQEEDTFRAIIWRCGEATGQITGQATGQVTGQATGQAERVVLVVNGEMTRSQIQQLIGLAHRETFVDNYINPALRSGLIELKYPDSITHPNQRYMLTEKGLQLKKQLESEIKDNKNS